MTRTARRALAIVALVVLAAGCGSSEPARPTPAPPSPFGVVAQVVSPSDVVLVDGRRVHVAMMNGSDPTTACDEQADRALAQRLIADGRTVVVSQPRRTDTPTEVPPGYAQADMRTPSAQDYATTFLAQQPDARETACPTPTPTSVPSETSSPSSGSDTEVDVDVDRDGESRYCRRHWYC